MSSLVRDSFRGVTWPLGLRRRVDDSSLSPHVQHLHTMPLAQGSVHQHAAGYFTLECSEEVFAESAALTDTVIRMYQNRIRDSSNSEKNIMSPWLCPMHRLHTTPTERFLNFGQVFGSIWVLLALRRSESCRRCRDFQISGIKNYS